MSSDILERVKNSDIDKKLELQLEIAQIHELIKNKNYYFAYEKINESIDFALKNNLSLYLNELYKIQDGVRTMIVSPKQNPKFAFLSRRNRRSKSRHKVGRPKGSKNRKSKSRRKVGRPRKSKSRRKVGRPRKSKSRRKVGRPKGSKNRKSKSRRKVGRPKGSKNRRSRSRRVKLRSR